MPLISFGRAVGTGYQEGFRCKIKSELDPTEIANVMVFIPRGSIWVSSCCQIDSAGKSYLKIQLEVKIRLGKEAGGFTSNTLSQPEMPPRDCERPMQPPHSSHHHTHCIPLG